MDPTPHALTLPLRRIPAPERWFLAALDALTRCEIPWVRRLLIRSFISIFGVDLNEAAECDPDRYPHFNAFFTRALKAGARTPAPPPCLSSPVDGTLVSLGVASPSGLVSVKGVRFSWHGLIGPSVPEAGLFNPQAYFFNCYLAPRNYHRVHMPDAGRLIRAEWIPGRFRSVRPDRVARHPEILAGNERVLLTFATRHGPLLLILVAARLVGGIETPWCPARLAWRDTGQSFHEALASGVGTAFGRGDEIGRFNYGSSVLVIAPRAIWKPLHETGTLLVGEALARPETAS